MAIDAAVLVRGLRRFEASGWRCGHPPGERFTCCGACAADGLAALHEEALKGALSGECPVGDARVDQIRGNVPEVADGALVRVDFREVRDLLAALDFYRVRCAALEGLLEDVARDEGFERGRRAERAECLAIAEKEGWTPVGTDRVGHGAARSVANAIKARGPLPEPLPGDKARARAEGLEASLREARAALMHAATYRHTMAQRPSPVLAAIQVIDRALGTPQRDDFTRAEPSFPDVPARPVVHSGFAFDLRRVIEEPAGP